MLLLPFQELKHEWGRGAGQWGAPPGDVSTEGYILWLTIMWMWTGLWRLAWKCDRADEPAMTLWVLAPLARTVPAAARLHDSEHGWLLVLEVLVGVAMLAWPARREPARTLWATGATVMAIAIVIGAAYTLSGMEGQARGEWWSVWEDPRPGINYEQFPLSNTEAVRAGIALLGLGVVLLAPLVWTFRRVWRPRPQHRPARCDWTTD